MGRPTWWAGWAVRSASLPLPSEHRWRYRQEFLVELSGMTPAEQRHHATGIRARVWTLRVALTEPARRLAKPCTADSESTAGSGYATPKAAGTANAVGAGRNGRSAAEAHDDAGLTSQS